MEVKEEFDEFLINDDVQMFSLGRNLKHKNIILSTEVITKALLKIIFIYYLEQIINF